MHWNTFRQMEITIVSNIVILIDTKDQYAKSECDESIGSQLSHLLLGLVFFRFRMKLNLSVYLIIYKLLKDKFFTG